MVYNNECRDVLVFENFGIEKDLEDMLKQIGFVPHLAETREEFLEIYHDGMYSAAVFDCGETIQDEEVDSNHVALDLAYRLVGESGIKVALVYSGELSPRMQELQNSGLSFIQKPFSENDLRRFLTG